MQYTENHNFKLPDGTDRFDIQHQNDNWSSMDTLLEDYLPLTAGSTKPLSSPLYIENTYGKARLTVGSAGGVTLAARNEADDTSTVGLHSFISDNKGYAIVFGDGGEIRLRPNGLNTTTGQVCINATGQQVGGHPQYASTFSDALAYTASTTTNLTHIDITSGDWIVYGTLRFKPSASTSTYVRTCVTTSGTSMTVTNGATDAIASTGEYTHSLCVFWHTTSDTSLYFNFWSGVAGSITVMQFRIHRIN